MGSGNEELEGFLRPAVHGGQSLGVGQLGQCFDKAGSVFQWVDLKKLCLVLFPETSDSWSFLCVVGKPRPMKIKNFPGLGEWQGPDCSEEDTSHPAPASSPLPFTGAFQS